MVGKGFFLRHIIHGLHHWNVEQTQAAWYWQDILGPTHTLSVVYAAVSHTTHSSSSSSIVPHYSVFYQEQKHVGPSYNMHTPISQHPCNRDKDTLGGHLMAQ
jgi:hypothetical protein